MRVKTIDGAGKLRYEATLECEHCQHQEKTHLYNTTREKDIKDLVCGKCELTGHTKTIQRARRK